MICDVSNSCSVKAKEHNNYHLGQCAEIMMMIYGCQPGCLGNHPNCYSKTVRGSSPLQGSSLTFPKPTHQQMEQDIRNDFKADGANGRKSMSGPRLCMRWSLLPQQKCRLVTFNLQLRGTFKCLPSVKNNFETIDAGPTAAMMSAAPLPFFHTTTIWQFDIYHVRREYSQFEDSRMLQ